MIKSVTLFGTHALRHAADRWSTGWNRAAARLWLAILSLMVGPEWRTYLRRQAPYQAWLDANRMMPAGLADLEASLARAGEHLPLISVVMPIYRPQLPHLRSAIASVREQVFQHWELCLCDDGSAEPKLTDELRRLSADDPRIRVVHYPDNRGIAAATNSAAAMARGDVLLFLDQDDRLAADCLAEFAIAFASERTTDLVYSDSDKIDATGRRFAPSFKPGWSPWLLLSYMYPSHAIAMRRSLFDRLGGMKSAFDGSQDYDLLLRASEVARQIRHIPRVLYHWRVVPGSTALRADQKPGSIAAGQAAVAAAISRRGLPASVTRPDWAKLAGIGLFECGWKPAAVPASLVILPDGDRDPDPHWFASTIGAVPPSTEVVVVAKAEFGPTARSARASCPHARPLILVERGETLGRNLALACGQANGDIVVCLPAGFNPQGRDWLNGVSAIAAASGGVVGPRVIDPSGTVMSAGLIRPAGNRAYQPAFAGIARHRPGALYLARVMHECAAVPAVCMAAPRELVLDAILSAPDVDDVVAAGIAISEHARQAGHSVLVAAQIDVEAPCDLVAIGVGRAGLADPWHNPNLGGNGGPHRPRPVCPPVRQKEPVRLAVISHNLDREGAQSTLLDLLSGLRSSGHAEPVVISSAGGALQPELAALGIPVRVLARPGRKATAQAAAGYRSRLADMFRQLGAQAVLANTLDSYAAVNAAKQAGLGAIWWQHEGGSWRSHFRRLQWGEKALAFAAFGQSYRVLQVASATRRDWLPVATRDNFEVVRYGIPPARLEADLARWTRADARSALGIADETCTILLLGSVSARKSQADAIAAIRVMSAEQVRNLRVMIVGAFAEPRYRAELERMITSLPPTHRPAVSLCGPVPDTAAYFRAADLFVCCSKRESAPRAVVEAMAFGLPVLTTAVDGIPELVDNGKTGLFFEPGKPGDLAAKLALLADDVELRARLGRSGRDKFAQISDFDGMVDRFARLIREAAWQGGPGARAL